MCGLKTYTNLSLCTFFIFHPFWLIYAAHLFGLLTFPWRSHLSTWKTLMCLQHDIKVFPSPRRSFMAVSTYGLPLFFFFLFEQNEWLSVFPKQKYVHRHPQTNRSTGSAFTVLQSCPSRRICKSNYRPAVFREKECVPNNGKIKCGGGKKRRRRGWEEWTRGGLYVLVKVALRNKSSFECAPTQK